MNNLKAADDLDRLIEQMRHESEDTEFDVERVNGSLRRIAELGLLHNDVYLAREPSGQCTQAAVLIPEGFGVCIWGSAAEVESENAETRARLVFKPFAQCDPAEKEIVAAHVEEFFEDIVDTAYVAASRLAPDGAISAHEYFASRKIPQETLVRLP